MEDYSDGDRSLATVAPKAPVTRERNLNPRLQQQLPQPYLARALVAVDPAHPNGSEDHDDHGMSVLQQHTAFFDRNGDGIIYPLDTFRGCRDIGLGFFIALVSAFVIHISFSYASQPGWIPSLFLSIHINNIHKCKHGSDSETYDTEGRFDPAKFDAIFSKYAKTHGDALTADELKMMYTSNRNVYDFFGWFAGTVEWKILYTVAKDENGLLQKEAIRGVYDGTLFEQLQKKHKSN